MLSAAIVATALTCRVPWSGREAAARGFRVNFVGLAQQTNAIVREFFVFSAAAISKFAPEPGRELTVSNSRHS
jgi:hypothetical protein